VNGGSTMVSDLVSIVVPCFAMGRFIEDALRSVGEQIHGNWELIVVDDCGPNDGTAQAVQRFAGEHPTHRVEFIRHLMNHGVSAARNTAIEATMGDYVALLDPDDFWLPSHLGRAVAIFSENAAIDVVSAPVRIIHEHSDVTEQYGARPLDRSWFPASLASHNFIQPSATVIRRSSLLAAGCFDTAEDIQHVEDWDLWIKLATGGHRFYFREDIGCVYRKHPGGATSHATMMTSRIDALMSRHQVFFRQMTASLIDRLSERVETNQASQGKRLEAVEASLNVPLMNMILGIDRFFARVCSFARRIQSSVQRRIRSSRLCKSDEC
jgi:glycosyltransferase involved in cell wall biosynthesis